jgi:hypothetical protein
MRKAWFRIIWTVPILLLAMSASTGAQTLEGLAVLPADTFAAGPTSGQFIMPANGRTPPFTDRQPFRAFLRSCAKTTATIL